MNDSATSLDRLHDIVVPPPVSWWPPAPGWYFVIGLTAIGLLTLGYRFWKTWRANAYRRDALRELAAADSLAGIDELLRRVALVIAPRSQIASQTGERWPDWLDSRCAEPMPPIVRDQLATGVYRERPSPDDVALLRDYAAAWISQHQDSLPSNRVVPSRTPA